MAAYQTTASKAFASSLEEHVRSFLSAGTDSSLRNSVFLRMSSLLESMAPPKIPEPFFLATLVATGEHLLASGCPSFALRLFFQHPRVRSLVARVARAADTFFASRADDGSQSQSQQQQTQGQGHGGGHVPTPRQGPERDVADAAVAAVTAERPLAESTPLPPLLDPPERGSHALPSDAELAVRACYGEAKAQAQLAESADPNYLRPETIDHVRSALISLRSAINVSLMDLSLTWLTYNGSIIMYEAVQRPVALGLTAHVLDLVLFVVTALEARVETLAVNHLAWRTTLYVFVVMAFEDMGDSPAAAAALSRAIDKLHFLEELERSDAVPPPQSTLDAFDAAADSLLAVSLKYLLTKPSFAIAALATRRIGSSPHSRLSARSRGIRRQLLAAAGIASSSSSSGMSGSSGASGPDASSSSSRRSTRSSSSRAPSRTAHAAQEASHDSASSASSTAADPSDRRVKLYDSSEVKRAVTAFPAAADPASLALVLASMFRSSADLVAALSHALMTSTTRPLEPAVYPDDQTEAAMSLMLGVLHLVTEPGLAAWLNPSPVPPPVLKSSPSSRLLSTTGSGSGKPRSPPQLSPGASGSVSRNAPRSRSGSRSSGSRSSNTKGDRPRSPRPSSGSKQAAIPNAYLVPSALAIETHMSLVDAAFHHQDWGWFSSLWTAAYTRLKHGTMLPAHLLPLRPRGPDVAVDQALVLRLDLLGCVYSFRTKNTLDEPKIADIRAALTTESADAPAREATWARPGSRAGARPSSRAGVRPRPGSRAGLARPGSRSAKARATRPVSRSRRPSSRDRRPSSTASHSNNITVPNPSGPGTSLADSDDEHKLQLLQQIALTLSSCLSSSTSRSSRRRLEPSVRSVHGPLLLDTALFLHSEHDRLSKRLAASLNNDTPAARPQLLSPDFDIFVLTAIQQTLIGLEFYDQLLCGTIALDLGLRLEEAGMLREVRTAVKPTLATIDATKALLISQSHPAMSLSADAATLGPSISLPLYLQRLCTLEVDLVVLYTRATLQFGIQALPSRKQPGSHDWGTGSAGPGGGRASSLGSIGSVSTFGPGSTDGGSFFSSKAPLSNFGALGKHTSGTPTGSSRAAAAAANAHVLKRSTSITSLRSATAGSMSLIKANEYNVVIEARLLSETAKNPYRRAIVLLELAKIHQSRREQRALLDEAASLLDGARETETLLLAHAYPQSHGGAGGPTRPQPTLSRGKPMLPPPVLVYRTSQSMALRPPDLSDSAFDAAAITAYVLYGKPFGAGTSVATSNTELAGTGVRILVSPGAPPPTFTVRNLKRNTGYTFAFAAESSDGALVSGGISASTPELIACTPFPLDYLWSLFVDIAFVVRALGPTRDAATALFERFVSGDTSPAAESDAAAPGAAAPGIGLLNVSLGSELGAALSDTHSGAAAAPALSTRGSAGTNHADEVKLAIRSGSLIPHVIASASETLLRSFALALFRMAELETRDLRISEARMHAARAAATGATTPKGSLPLLSSEVYRLQTAANLLFGIQLGTLIADFALVTEAAVRTFNALAPLLDRKPYSSVLLAFLLRVYDALLSLPLRSPALAPHLEQLLQVRKPIAFHVSNALMDRGEYNAVAYLASLEQSRDNRVYRELVAGGGSGGGSSSSSDGAGAGAGAGSGKSGSTGQAVARPTSSSSRSRRRGDASGSSSSGGGGSGGPSGSAVPPVELTHADLPPLAQALEEYYIQISAVSNLSAYYRASNQGARDAPIAGFLLQLLSSVPPPSLFNDLQAKFVAHERYVEFGARLARYTLAHGDPDLTLRICAAVLDTARARHQAQIASVESMGTAARDAVAKAEASGFASARSSGNSRSSAPATTAPADSSSTGPDMASIPPEAVSRLQIYVPLFVARMRARRAWRDLVSMETPWRVELETVFGLAQFAHIQSRHARTHAIPPPPQVAAAWAATKVTSLPPESDKGAHPSSSSSGRSGRDSNSRRHGSRGGLVASASSAANGRDPASSLYRKAGGATETGPGSASGLPDAAVETSRALDPPASLDELALSAAVGSNAWSKWFSLASMGTILDMGDALHMFAEIADDAAIMGHPDTGLALDEASGTTSPDAPSPYDVQAWMAADGPMHRNASAVEATTTSSTRSSGGRGGGTRSSGGRGGGSSGSGSTSHGHDTTNVLGRVQGVGLGPDGAGTDALSPSEVLVHFQRVAVLAVRSRCWVQVLNACRAMWNVTRAMYPSLLSRSRATVYKPVLRSALALCDLLSYLRSGGVLFDPQFRAGSTVHALNFAAAGPDALYDGHLWGGVTSVGGGSSDSGASTGTSVTSQAPEPRWFELLEHEDIDMGWVLRYILYALQIVHEAGQPDQLLRLGRTFNGLTEGAFSVMLLPLLAESEAAVGDTAAARHHVEVYADLERDLSLAKKRLTRARVELGAFLVSTLHGLARAPGATAADAARVIDTYAKTVRYLESKRESFLLAQAFNEYGDVLHAEGRVAQAGAAWFEGLDHLLNTHQAFSQWRDALRALFVSAEAETVVGEARLASSSFLANLPHSGLLGIIMVGKMARLVAYDDMHLRRELCLLGSLLSGSLFQHSLAHPMTTTEYFLFEATDILHGVDVFDDAFVVSAPLLASSLEFIASTLVVEEATAESAPALALLRHVASRVVCSATLTAKAKLLTARALVDMGYVGDAVRLLFEIARGAGLPGPTPESPLSPARCLSYNPEALSEVGLGSTILEDALAAVPSPIKAAFDRGSAVYLESMYDVMAPPSGVPNGFLLHRLAAAVLSPELCSTIGWQNAVTFDTVRARLFLHIAKAEGATTRRARLLPDEARDDVDVLLFALGVAGAGSQWLAPEPSDAPPAPLVWASIIDGVPHSLDDVDLQAVQASVRAARASRSRDSSSSASGAATDNGNGNGNSNSNGNGNKGSAGGAANKGSQGSNEGSGAGSAGSGAGRSGSGRPVPTPPSKPRSRSRRQGGRRRHSTTAGAAGAPPGNNTNAGADGSGSTAHSGSSSSGGGSGGGGGAGESGRGPRWRVGSRSSRSGRSEGTGASSSSKLYTDVRVDIVHVDVMHVWLLESVSGLAHGVLTTTARNSSTNADASGNGENDTTHGTTTPATATATAPATAPNTEAWAERVAYSPFFGRDSEVEAHLLLASVAEEKLSLAEAEKHVAAAQRAIVAFSEFDPRTNAAAAGATADTNEPGEASETSDGSTASREAAGNSEEDGSGASSGSGSGSGNGESAESAEEPDGSTASEGGEGGEGGGMGWRPVGVDNHGVYYWLHIRTRLASLLVEAGHISRARDECAFGVHDAKSVRDLVQQSRLVLWTGVVAVLEGDVEGGITCLEQLTEQAGLPATLRVRAGALLGDIQYSRNSTVDALRSYVAAHDTSFGILQHRVPDMDGLLGLFRALSRGSSGAGTGGEVGGRPRHMGEAALTGRAGRYHPHLGEALRTSTRVAFVYHRLLNPDSALRACLKSLELASLTFAREASEHVALYGVFGRVLGSVLKQWNQDNAVFGPSLLRRGGSLASLAGAVGTVVVPTRRGNRTRTTRTETQTNVVHHVAGPKFPQTDVRGACYRLARWALANAIELNQGLTGYDFEYARSCVLAMGALAVSDAMSKDDTYLPSRSLDDEFFGLLSIADGVAGMKTALASLSSKIGSDAVLEAQDELPEFIRADLRMYRTGVGAGVGGGGSDDGSSAGSEAEPSAFEVLAYYLSLRREKNLVPFFNDRQLRRLGAVHEYLAHHFAPYEDACTPGFSTLGWLVGEPGTAGFVSTPARSSVCFQWANDADAHYTRVDVVDEKALLHGHGGGGGGGGGRGSTKRSVRIIPVRLLYVVHAVIVPTAESTTAGRGQADPLAQSTPVIAVSSSSSGPLVGQRRRKSVVASLMLPSWGGGGTGGGSRAGSRVGSRMGSRAGSRVGRRGEVGKPQVRLLRGAVELPLARVTSVHQMLSKLKFQVQQHEMNQELAEAREAASKASAMEGAATSGLNVGELNSPGSHHAHLAGRGSGASGTGTSTRRRRRKRTSGASSGSGSDAMTGGDGARARAGSVSKSSSSGSSSSSSSKKKEFPASILRAYQTTLLAICKLFATPLERDENGRIVEAKSRMSASLRSLSVVGGRGGRGGGESTSTSDSDNEGSDGEAAEAFAAKFANLQPPSLTAKNLDLLVRALDVSSGVLANNSSVSVWLAEVLRLTCAPP